MSDVGALEFVESREEKRQRLLSRVVRKARQLRDASRNDFRSAWDENPVAEEAWRELDEALQVLDDNAMTEANERAEADSNEADMGAGPL